MLHAQIGVREQGTHGVRHHHLQRADIAAHSFGARGIEELDVLGFIDAIVHSFYRIINTCTDGPVLHFEPKLRKNFRKCASDADI